ncbi:34996_t:CDS:2, partial [Racocetra persica]
NASDTLPEISAENPSNIDPLTIEDDPMDLCINIPNLYHLLDLRKDMGSNGFAVDKIIIAQNSLKKFCNYMVPNSFKSISEIDYASLNSKLLNLTGIYGTRESIAKYLFQKNLIDEQIHSQLIIRDENNTKNRPSLKTGIYLLIKDNNGLVIHWPEEDCYNVQVSNKKKNNSVTLHRYFTKLTDVHFCLLSKEELMTFDFNLRKKSLNKDKEEEDDGDDDDIDSEYAVNEIQQDKTDFNIFKGFELNLPESINTNLTLPSSFPSTISIESCHHQSFLTCHINEPSEISKSYEHPIKSSELQPFISNYLYDNDSSIQISQSIEFNSLISLAKILQIEKELLDSFEKEKRKAIDDHEEAKKTIIAIETNSLKKMVEDRLLNIYGQ